MTCSQGLSHGRYLRLMALASIEIIATIPLGLYILISTAKEGVGSWQSWATMHSHYSEVYQVPSVVWRNNRGTVIGLEMFRWLLVACSFVFFAFFGFADEARQHYRLVYKSLASRIGLSTFILRGSSHGCVLRSLFAMLVSPDQLMLTFSFPFLLLQYFISSFCE